MQVVVNSLLTTYERRGKGKLLLFLHGWGDTSAGMRQLRTALAAQYEVLALDLPGFGGTQAPGRAWGLDDYADFVRAFLEKISAPEVTVIIGHSNGGALAIRGVASGKLTAERVVLLASAGIRTPKSLRNQMLKIMAKATKIVIKPLPRHVQQKLRHRAYGAIGSDYLVAEHMQETFKRVVSEDVRDDAVQLPIPVLLVYGENDTAAPVWYGELYHELIADSTLIVLPGAGHFVHVDRADDVLKAIREFMR